MHIMQISRTLCNPPQNLPGLSQLQIEEPATKRAEASAVLAAPGARKCLDSLKHFWTLVDPSPVLGLVWLFG